MKIMHIYVRCIPLYEDNQYYNLVCSLALKHCFLQLDPSVTLILTITFISVFVNAHWISRTEDRKTCRNNIYYSLMIGESGNNKFHSSTIKMGITPGLIVKWLLYMASLYLTFIEQNPLCLYSRMVVSAG